MAETASGKRLFPGLSARAYEHPADRAALQALRSVPGFDLLVRKTFRGVGDRALRLAFLASAVRVGPRQLAPLHERHVEACMVLGVDPVPELYVAQTPFLNAGVAGVDRPFVVLDAAALSLLDLDEVQFLLAHELGHVLAGHALYKTLLQLLLRTAWPALSFPLGGAALLGVTAAMLEWDRLSELSADRAGLLVVQSPEIAERVAMKVAAGHGPFDVEEVVRQADEYDAGGAVAESLLKLIRATGQTHAFPVLRLAELRRWIGSGAYREILEGRYATGEAAAEASPAGRRLAATQRALISAARGMGARAQALSRTMLDALRPAKTAAPQAPRRRARKRPRPK